MLTPADILGPAGSIAARLERYESRPEQLRMAEAVARSLAEGRHLIVEAGTGVGKSFAYLTPAILAAAGAAPFAAAAAAESGDDDDNDDRKKSGEPSRRRIVISTHTISLQEQLVAKDLPFLKTVIPCKFSAVLAKGRRNYVSLRRLNAAAARARSLFYSADEIEQVAELVAWSKTTADGSLSDLPFRPADAVWDEAASDSGNCLGRKCPRHADCHYFRARKSLTSADILIVNHALFFTDLVLREKNVNLLPKYHAVIFDEAHTIESVAGDHFGLGVTSGQINYTLNKLQRGEKGLLAVFPSSKVSRLLDRCRRSADVYFDQAFALLGKQSGRSQRISTPRLIEEDLPAALCELAQAVDKHAETIRPMEDKQDFLAASQRLAGLATEISEWSRQSLEEAVYWIESGQPRRGGRPPVTLSAAPVNVGPMLKRLLFDKVGSVILTSATLSIGKNPSFDFYQSRIGLEGARQLRLGSPFNYRKQVGLILLQGMPDPSRDKERYDDLCIDMIRRYVARTDGRAFVLFTSHQSMRRATADLAPWFADEGMTLISQSDGLPRGQMVNRFKTEPRAVLFGTDSFWQGVDVPGDALQNVIITKLPFTAPDQPLLEARLDAIRRAGRNPFVDYQLPEAVIKLRQGFGRLIRTQRDRGIVVLFDPRLKSKPYGRTFLESLPDCQVSEEWVEEWRPGANGEAAQFKPALLSHSPVHPIEHREKRAQADGQERRGGEHEEQEVEPRAPPHRIAADGRGDAHNEGHQEDQPQAIAGLPGPGDACGVGFVHAVSLNSTDYNADEREGDPGENCASDPLKPAEKSAFLARLAPPARSPRRAWLELSAARSRRATPVTHKGTPPMTRALLLLSAVALISVSIGCRTPCGNSCGNCRKGILDYKGGCKGGNCGDADCDDCDGEGGGMMDRMRAKHASRRATEEEAPGGMAPQYTYPYYTTRGPRDFLLDNPPTIGY